MSIQTSGTPYDQRQRLTAEQVRAANFERAPLGRRGLDEHEVQSFLERLADELGTRDAEIVRLLDENRRLKHAVREWHRRQEGHDPAELMARTQQQIDAQIAQAEEYSREREEEATRLYDQIVNEARERARSEAPSVPVSTRWQPGIGSGGRDHDPGQGATDRQQAYVKGLLQALDALAAHVDATRQAFTLDVGKLGGGLDGGTELGDNDGHRVPQLGHTLEAPPSLPVEPATASPADSLQGSAAAEPAVEDEDEEEDASDVSPAEQASNSEDADDA